MTNYQRAFRNVSDLQGLEDPVKQMIEFDQMNRGHLYINFEGSILEPDLPKVPINWGGNQSNGAYGDSLWKFNNPYFEPKLGGRFQLHLNLTMNFNNPPSDYEIAVKLKRRGDGAVLHRFQGDSKNQGSPLLTTNPTITTSGVVNLDVGQEYFIEFEDVRETISSRIRLYAVANDDGLQITRLPAVDTDIPAILGGGLNA